MLEFDVSEAIYHAEIVSTTQQLQRAAAENAQHAENALKSFGTIEWEDVPSET